MSDSQFSLDIALVFHKGRMTRNLAVVVVMVELVVAVMVGWNRMVFVNMDVMVPNLQLGLGANNFVSSVVPVSF